MKLNDRFALIKILTDKVKCAKHINIYYKLIMEIFPLLVKVPEELFLPKSFDRNPDLFEIPDLTRASQLLQAAQPIASSEDGAVLSNDGKKINDVDIKNSIDDLADEINFQPHTNLNQFYKNNEGAEETPVQLYHMNQRMQKYLN